MNDSTLHATPYTLKSLHPAPYTLHEGMNDFERSRQMGIRGRQRCADEFNWDKIAWHTENVYYDVMGWH